MSWQNYYRKPDASVWQGRKDALAQQYIFQSVTCAELTAIKNKQPGIALIGFQCDAGIERNLGRTGAKQGPYALRECLAKLSIHKDIFLYDVGNIFCDNGDVESAQESLADAVTELLANHFYPIVIGGGHETAWGHYQGISNFANNKSTTIINFDAHFDLRTASVSTSGTPFKQIADYADQFDYNVFGIQKFSNTKNLFQTAQELGVNFILADDIHQHNDLLAAVDSVIARADSIYLSICLDVFSACIAPGVSAVQSFGLYLEQVLPTINKLARSGKVISFDIVELAPCYDIDKRTAKLAAKIVAEFIHNLAGN